VRKNDGKKHMVQNFYYLNEWTVKNNYPLPLISDIENIGYFVTYFLTSILVAQIILYFNYHQSED